MSENDIRTTGGYCLRLRGSEIPVSGTGMVIGRSQGCEIYLDDALISRRHAVVFARDDGIVVQDLGSANGSFVNGTRIAEPCLATQGDQILVGKHLLEVFLTSAVEASAAETRFDPQADTGTHDLLADHEVQSSEPTKQGNSLALLGEVAERMISVGKTEQAEAMMSAHLDGLLLEARSGPVLPESRNTAMACALAIAGALRQARWVDYVFLLGTATRQLPPAAVIDRLYDVLRIVPPIRLGSLREYLSVLQAEPTRWGPAERFLLRRLQGLEALAASR